MGPLDNVISNVRMFLSSNKSVGRKLSLKLVHSTQYWLIIIKFLLLTDIVQFVIFRI